MIGAAVYRSKPLSAEGLRERLFTLAFSNLVYAQIWEDPAVDLEALALDGTSRVVTIASGGCNVLSYLTAGPEHVAAVDINGAHVALNRLKLAAARHLPDYESFYRFFGAANASENVAAFKPHILPHLDPETAAYWQSRHGLRRRRRIKRFTSNFYRAGLLGSFIGASHLVARLNGVNPRMILKARTLEEQRRIFDQKFAPLFDRRALRWLVNRPASLYGLGIPPAQYKALAGDGEGGMAEVLKKRLERLACGFPCPRTTSPGRLSAAAMRPRAGRLPPYLDPANFEVVRENAPRVSVHHASFTDYLASAPDGSLDRYVLLDAQDWMNDAMLTGLWAGNHPDGTSRRACDLPHRRRSDDPTGTHTGTHPLPLALCGGTLPRAYPEGPFRHLWRFPPLYFARVRTMQAAATAAEKMDAIYSRQRFIYDATRRYYLLGRDRLIGSLKPPLGGAVLEIGCGTARNLIRAAKRYPDARFYGIDISEAMLKSARTSVARAGLRSRVALGQGDATAFQPAALFGREAFDRIYISYSLSMIPPWQDAAQARHGATGAARTIAHRRFRGFRSATQRSCATRNSPGCAVSPLCPFQACRERSRRSRRRRGLPRRPKAFMAATPSRCASTASDSGVHTKRLGGHLCGFPSRSP